MPFSSAGTFTRLYNFLKERVANPKIQTARLDAELDGIATALTTIGAATSTITANIPSDFDTLQDAIDHYSTRAVKQGTRINLNIESGHQPESGIDVSGGFFGHFWITSDDATVTLGSGFTGKFISGQNAHLPVLDCLIDANGLGTVGYEASNTCVGFISAGSGVKNSGSVGLEARTSTIYGHSSVWSGAAEAGLIIQQAATVALQEAQVNDCGTDATSNAIYVSRGSVLNFASGSCTNSTGFGVLVRRSLVNLLSATITGAGAQGVFADHGSYVVAVNATVSGSTDEDLFVRYGSQIHASGCTTSGGGTPSLADTNVAAINKWFGAGAITSHQHGNGGKVFDGAVDFDGSAFDAVLRFFDPASGQQDLKILGAGDLHPAVAAAKGLVLRRHGTSSADLGLAIGRQVGDSGDGDNILLASNLGVIVGSPTGASKGAGKINAVEVYDNGNRVATATDLSDHENDTSNPHSVTKTQVGLGNVTNDAQLKIASNLSDVNNTDTSKNNLGLGTGDSPQFAGVNIGHATDTTLARAEAGEITVEGSRLYHRGNIVGTVSQSSGTPTGTVIEQGSNANGEYTRWADGTQICWIREITVSFENTSSITADWTLPVAFTAPTETAVHCALARNASSHSDPTARHGLFTGRVIGVSADTAEVGMVSAGEYTSGDEAIISVTAIGRWF